MACMELPHSCFPISLLAFRIYVSILSLLPYEYGLITNSNSSHLGHLFSNRLLALKLPTNSRGILHMGHVALPRPPSSRVSCRPYVLPLSKLRHQSSFDGFRKRAVDVCGWVLGTTCHFERVLEVCVSLH